MKRARQYKTKTPPVRKRRRTYKPYTTEQAVETKFFDTTLSAVIDLTGEAIQPSLNLIPQSVTQSGRIGRKCTIVNIDYQGNVYWATMSAANYLGAMVKIAIVLDKQCNGAAPVWNDVYVNSDTYAFRNMSNIERFKVLKTFYVQPCYGVNSFDAATISAPPTMIEYHKKVSIPLEFSSTTGAITEIRSNNICVLAMSKSGDDVHTLESTARVKFVG